MRHHSICRWHKHVKKFSNNWHVLLLRNTGLSSILQVLASDNAFKKGEFNEQYPELRSKHFSCTAVHSLSTSCGFTVYNRADWGVGIWSWENAGNVEISLIPAWSGVWSGQTIRCFVHHFQPGYAYSGFCRSAQHGRIPLFSCLIWTRKHDMSDVPERSYVYCEWIRIRFR